MLYSLKELVFGLNEFEKAKIDDRINQAFLLVPKLKLERLEDFEILEENIYKLKEQLRIKSSNLNRVIKASKLISKKQVLNFIKDLENIRYEFLKQVFSQIEPSKTIENKINNNLNDNSKQLQNLEQEKSEKPKEEKKEQQEQIKEQPENQNKNKELKQEEKIQTQKENKFTLSENKKYTIILNNGKIPYLTIKYKERFELQTLKQISSLFFEIYQMHGTNIIIENNIALIIPRFQSDNLIELPKIQSNLEEIYSKLTQKTKPQQKEQIKEKPEKQNKNERTEDNYLEINNNFKKPDFQTKKHQEDSLDALLLKHEEKHTPKDEIKPTKAENNSEIIKEPKTEQIKLERKEKETKTPEIEILKDETKSEQEQPQTQNSKQIQQHQFEIYRDENIVAYFKPNSKILGQLNLTTPTGENISQLPENSLSYLTMFSKIFASVLFETIGCHGTNIMWNFKENTLEIIPRFQDDKLPLQWELKQADPKFLKSIKDKLHTTILIEQEKNKPKTDQIVEEKPKSAIEENENDSQEEKEQKAKHLLDSLRRIP